MEKNKIMEQGQSFGNSTICFIKNEMQRLSVIVALVVVLFLNSCKTSKNKELGTFDDPKVALIETHKALTLLSKNLNKGYESAAYLKEYEATKDKIFNID